MFAKPESSVHIDNLLESHDISNAQSYISISLVITADKSHWPTIIISEILQKYINNYINNYAALLYTYL